jgi:putative SOS response-associated peptidase YedK
MCGRFTLATPPEIVAEFFELAVAPELTSRYNIAPTQPAPAILVDETNGGRAFRSLHWGLIPTWAKEASIGSRMINARAETLAEKPSFRTAFKRRRCLIATDGFYEWQKLDRGKQPHCIRMADDAVFAMAGLWERWRSPDGSQLDSCTIITTEPNELLAPIHDRMPVILAHDRFGEWLDPENKDTESLERLLRPFPADAMRYFPVSTRVNAPAIDDVGCVAPIARE